MILNKANASHTITSEEKDIRIKKAAYHYGKFLQSLGFDYESDPQTIDTPMRVAKSWANDLIKGSLTEAPKITTFPNEEAYDGIVIQTGIKVNSMCAHHNLPFYGYAAIAYLPESRVIGLSKLNRIVDWFSRRPQMQESLTQQIHTYLSDMLQCSHVAVSISSHHLCCGMRGISHPDSLMTTNKFSGRFLEKDNLVREEFMHAIRQNNLHSK
jgi:GTP cyclohydrolase I